MPGEEREAEKPRNKKPRNKKPKNEKPTRRPLGRQTKPARPLQRNRQSPMPQYTNDTGFLRGAASANGTEHEVDLDDVYFVAQSPCATVVAREAERPGVEHPPERRWNGAAGSRGGCVRCCQQGGQRLTDRAQGQDPRVSGMGPTHQEPVERLERVFMTATAKGGRVPRRY